MRKEKLLSLGICTAVMLIGCGKQLSEDELAAKEIGISVEEYMALKGEGETASEYYKEDLLTEVEDCSTTVNSAKEEVLENAMNKPYLICIDAGHQSKANSAQEPIGPGSSTTKPKVASGTKGVSTGIPEYKMTLAVSLKLKEELEARGYQVLMVREENDVDISNSERAMIANDANADAFIRIHGDGSESSSVSGATALCQTANNKYNGDLHPLSYALAQSVLSGLVNECGCKSRGISQVDNMSGINWCTVPVTIIEVGFMTNPSEDQLLGTDEYQYKIATGIANGLDNYFAELEDARTEQ